MFTMPVSSVDSGRSNDNYGNWNNPFVYLVWMWAFSMFGGNGLWGNRNGAGAVETQAITASQVDDIRAQVAAIRQGIECGDANIMRAVDQLADTARANQIKLTEASLPSTKTCVPASAPSTPTSATLRRLFLAPFATSSTTSPCRDASSLTKCSSAAANSRPLSAMSNAA